jgi:hypothetical protein
MDLIKQDIPSLLGRLAGELSNLAKDEVALAKIELRQSAKEAAADSAAMAAGASLIYAGLLFYLVAATYGLAMVMPLWLAAAIVGTITILVGCVATKMGAKRLKTEVPGLPRTQQTLKTNGHHLKEQLS